MRVTRRPNRHELEDWTVEVLLPDLLEGEATDGNHAQLPAADTINSLVYLVASQSLSTSLELFAMGLVQLILARNPHLNSAEVNVHSHLWRRLAVYGAPSPTAFMKGSDERQTTTVSCRQDASFEVRSGFEKMVLLKTAQPLPTGVREDELTTLQETGDRLFSASIAAEWTYLADALATDAAFDHTRQQVREALTHAFAQHRSRNLRETLLAMGEAALKATAAPQRLFLRLSDRHAPLLQLDQSGDETPHQIFVPGEELHDIVEASLERVDER